MRTKRAPFHLESELVARKLEIVVQQVEPGVLLHSEPYDASPPKVRERAHTAERHRQLAVPRGDGGHGVLDFRDARFRLLTKKLECEMKTCFSDPRDVRSTVAKRGRRGIDLAPHLRRQINRQKQPHASPTIREARRNGSLSDRSPPARSPRRRPQPRAPPASGASSTATVPPAKAPLSRGARNDEHANPRRHQAHATLPLP